MAQQGLFRKKAFACALCIAGPAAFVPHLAQASDFILEEGRELGTHAAAQNAKTYDTAKMFGAERIRDRDRKWALPDGLRLGNFQLLPSVTLNSTYDDNVLTTLFHPQDDLRQQTSVSFKILSQFPRHVFDVLLDVDDVRYLDHPDYSFTNASFVTRGKIDIDAADIISAKLTFRRLHEDRIKARLPETISSPIPTTLSALRTAFRRDAGRLSLTLGATVTDLDFDDVKTFSNQPIDQDFRDTWAIRGFIQPSYKFSPGFYLDAKASMEKRENRGNEIIDRDRLETSFYAGLTMEFSPLWKGFFRLGYARDTFSHDNLNDLETFLFEGEMHWMATQLVTVYGKLRRDIIDDSFADIAVSIVNKAELLVEYEANRDIVLGAGTSLIVSQFPQDDERADVEFRAHLALEYFYHKNIFITSKIEYVDRVSELDAFSFKRNRYSLSVRFSR